MKAPRKGFTLVEIVIILVIIGLLLGGILKGREMITHAKVKNVIADFSGMSAAFYGYQDRYRAIPGDDPNAATRWTTAPVAIAGNGNGVVGGTYNNACPAVAVAGTPETCLWWDDLRRAGFVAGNGAAQPLNAVGGLIGVQTGDNAGGAVMGGLSGLIVCSANLPANIAIAVDTQIDDGNPSTGAVRGAVQNSSNSALDNTPAAAYDEAGTKLYVLCRRL